MYLELGFEHKLSYHQALQRVRGMFQDLKADFPPFLGPVQEGWMENGGFLKVSSEHVKIVVVVTLPQPGRLELSLFGSFPGDNLFGKKLEKIMREAIEEQLSY